MSVDACTGCQGTTKKKYVSLTVYESSFTQKKSTNKPSPENIAEKMINTSDFNWPQFYAISARLDASTCFLAIMQMSNTQLIGVTISVHRKLSIVQQYNSTTH